MSMEALFSSGDIVFVILAIMLAEALVLMRHMRRQPGLWLGLAAGACLVLALRAALLQQGWAVIAGFMLASFVFHGLEVWQWLRPAR
jgi:CBS-domain-containing membrane protein